MSTGRSIVALGLRLAWSPQPAQRWRQASILLASALVTFVVAAGIAFVGAAATAEDRAVGRLAVLGEDVASAPLRVVPRANLWDGRQFPVVWLDGDESSPLPPGLDSLPAPGTVVVSPAIAKDRAAVNALGYTLSPAGTGTGGTIGPEGLLADSEWLVYARADRSLGTQGNVAGVIGFGRADATTPQMGFVTDPAMPSTWLATIGVLWLVVIPSALLLTLCASSFSPLRLSRARTLHLVGLSRSSIAAVDALETAALAAPAALVGLASWLLTAPHVRDVPGTGITLIDSALAGSRLSSVLVCATVVIATAVVGAMPTRAQRRSQTVTHRPTWFSALPLGLGLAGMLMAKLVGPPSSVPILVVTLLATTIAFPVAVPVIVQTLGGRVARSARPHRWLAGRRLSFSPTALARPALGVGVLVLVVGSFTGLYLQQAATGSEGTTGAFSTGWRSPQVGDVSDLRSRLAGAVVAPLDDQSTAWFGTCDEAARAIGLDGCAGPLSPEQVLAAFEERTHLTAAIGELPPAPAAYAQDVVVFGPEVSLDDVQAAVAHLPAGNTSTLGAETLRPALSSGWMAAGALLAAALLVLAALHSFANRAFTAFREDDDLLALGLETTQVRAVQRWTVTAPLLAVIPAAAVSALAFTWSASSSDVTVTATPQILAEAAVVAVASGLVILLIGRMQRQHLEASQLAG